MFFMLAQKPAQNEKRYYTSNIPELKNKILFYIRQNGPVLPVHISKAFNSDTLFAGAILSELIANKLVKVTFCKIGGSPLYYLPGQESKLTMVRDYLSQRPRQAFDILREKKVLRDSACEPWQRVALREIKDFAIPLDVTIGNNNELFWKWYTLSDEEAKQLIYDTLKNEFPEIKQEAPEAQPENMAEKSEPSTAVQEKTVQSFVVETQAKKTKVSGEQSVYKRAKESEFRNELMKLFSKKEIEVLEEKAARKNAELNFVIRMPSAIGDLICLAIAKNKKKLNEDDVQLAYASGIEHKLPVLLFGRDIGARAKKLLESNMRGVAFRKI